MNIKHLIKSSEHFLSKNSPAILTGIGVVGVVTTAYLTHKAAVKATNEIRYASRTELAERQMSPREKFDLTWKLYIAPVAVGALSIAAIVCANRVGTRRTAAMAAAAALVERSYDEYRGKVKEVFGEKKETEVQQKIAQDQITAHPPAQFSMAKQGKVLTRDAFSGRYFDCDVETIRRAENKVNKFILDNDACSLTYFYDKVGLAPTDISDDIGWNHDKMLEVDIQSVIVPKGVPGVPEGLPAISFSFASLPMPDPHKYR